MVQIDLNVDGAQQVRQRLVDLEHDWGEGEVWAVGTNTKYGRILEFGRGPVSADDGYLRFEGENGEIIFRKEVSGHPPYPWFRPAIREFEANPERFLLENTEFGSLDEISSTGEFVRSVALALQERMRDNVNAQDPSRDRSPGTHPDHPRRQSDTLSSSIRAIRIK